VSQLDQSPPPRRRTKPVVWIAAALTLLALIAGTVGGLAAHASSGSQSESSVAEPAATPAATETAQRQHAQKPSRTKKAPAKTYNFTSCNDVWASGQGPFKRGEPGYTEQLDPDGDGIACPSRPPG
jgi:hypothetical protein